MSCENEWTEEATATNKPIVRKLKQERRKPKSQRERGNEWTKTGMHKTVNIGLHGKCVVVANKLEYEAAKAAEVIEAAVTVKAIGDYAWAVCRAMKTHP